MRKVKQRCGASNLDKPTKTSKRKNSNKEELIERIKNLFRSMDAEIAPDGEFESSIYIEIDLPQPEWDSDSIIQNVINGDCPHKTLNNNIPVVDEEEIIQDALADCESEISDRLCNNINIIKEDWSDSEEFAQVLDLLEELQDKYGQHSNKSN